MPEQKVSEILKSRREQKRFSLHSVHQETRISMAYLEALESAQWTAFPAEVYLLGFLRKYATYLGLNPEEMIQLYQKEQGVVREKKEEEAKKQMETHKEEENTTVMRAVLLGVIILIVGVWLLFTLLRAVPSHNKKAESAPVKMKEIEPVQGKDEKLSLSLTAIDPVWVRVVSEQGLIFEGFLNARSSRTYEANDELSVRMGNVYAVRLALNGRNIDPTVGSSKSVGDLVLTKKSLYDENLYRARASSEPATTRVSSMSAVPSPKRVREVHKSTATPTAPVIGPQSQ